MCLMRTGGSFQHTVLWNCSNFSEVLVYVRTFGKTTNPACHTQLHGSKGGILLQTNIFATAVMWKIKRKAENLHYDNSHGEKWKCSGGWGEEGG